MEEKKCGNQISEENIYKERYIYEKERTQQGGLSFFAVLWEAGMAADYIKEILQTGGCSCYLPVRFLKQDGIVKAYYDDTGFLPLEKCIRTAKRRGESVLRFSIKLLRQLAEGEEEAENWLLFRNGIRYRMDSIFYCEGTGQTAMAYIPAGVKRSFPQRVCLLAEELQENYPDAGLEILTQRLEEEFRKGASGSKALLRLFSGWEREI